METVLEVLNPVAPTAGQLERLTLVPRPPSLEGKRVGLYWNYKRGGDVALKRVGDFLQARFPGLKTDFLPVQRGPRREVLHKLVQGYDAVVGSTAD